MLETYSKCTFNYLTNAKKEISWEVKSVLQEIEHWLADIQENRFSLIKRENNKEAD